MKCICGYKEEYEQYSADEAHLVNEKFIKSTLTLTINRKQGEWDHDRFETKQVYVCPSCGTLKIVLDGGEDND